MACALVVDDKEENLYFLEALLKGNGWAIQTARHGAEALLRARQNPPGVIISDLLMPVMDGYTLLRHWKADPGLKNIPFVVYTATYTEPDDERLALDLGADAFILKPAEPEEFMKRLLEVRDSAARAVAREPLSGDLEEKEMLKHYSETLIRKLEDKSLELAEANKQLQADIKRREQIEETLRESEERYRATFEQASVGIAHIAPEGRFLRVNDKLCAITGYSRDELLNLTISDLAAPGNRDESEAAREIMLAGQTDSISTERRYRKKDGSEIWVHLEVALLKDRAGAPKYFVSMINDVTERRKLQQQFLRAQRMESIGTLAGGIAHDLNNVLAPIVMSIDLLRFEKADEETASLLRTLQTSAQRGADLVKQVLSFARGVEGQRVPVNPIHLFSDLRSIVRDTFPKSIQFDINYDRAIPSVIGDPTQLNQVFLNLCVNARDAMPQGGALTICIENVLLDETCKSLSADAHPGPYVLIKVSDTGMGIPAEIREKIFEPFFTTKEVGKGTGLGLSTTLAIVKSHGGFIDVYSELGRGSEFRVYLPANLDEAAPEQGDRKTPTSAGGNGELILVVDDEDAIRKVAQNVLEHNGYRVLVASNGADALAKFLQQPSDIALVLTDMALPVMDGAALAVALRAANSKIKIIATSGLPVPSGPASDLPFIQKPYTAETLLRRVHESLAAKS